MVNEHVEYVFEIRDEDGRVVWTHTADHPYMPWPLPPDYGRGYTVTVDRRPREPQKSPTPNHATKGA